VEIRPDNWMRNLKEVLDRLSNLNSNSNENERIMRISSQLDHVIMII